jgi:hypothetical protein
MVLMHASRGQTVAIIRRSLGLRSYRSRRGSWARPSNGPGGYKLDAAPLGRCQDLDG